MTGPPKLDSKITMGVSTNRGPISIRESLVVSVVVEDLWGLEGLEGLGGGLMV